MGSYSVGVGADSPNADCPYCDAAGIRHRHRAQAFVQRLNIFEYRRGLVAGIFEVDGPFHDWEIRISDSYTCHHQTCFRICVDQCVLTTVLIQL